MTGKKSERRSECPTAYALDIFGDRWTLLIVRDLLIGGKSRYKDFLEAGEGIATNILADRLGRLEAWGIVTSAPDPVNRRVKRYRLTQKGLDLAPMMLEMILWSARYDPDTGAPKAFLRRAQRDREGLLADLVEGARARAVD